MSELTSMMNIGKEMAKKLTSVGIDSAERPPLSQKEGAFHMYYLTTFLFSQQTIYHAVAFFYQDTGFLSICFTV